MNTSDIPDEVHQVVSKLLEDNDAIRAQLDAVTKSRDGSHADYTQALEKLRVSNARLEKTEQQLSELPRYRRSGDERRGMTTQICTQCEREVDVTEFFGMAGCVNHPCGCKGNVPGLMKKPKNDFELFGIKVWEFIESQGGDFCDEEISVDILPLAQEAGLCKRVKYDPAVHGEINAEPGCEIWFWGEEEKHER